MNVCMSMCSIFNSTVNYTLKSFVDISAYSVTKVILLTPVKSRPYEKRETSIHLRVHKETGKNKRAFEGPRHGVQGRESTHVHKAPPLADCRAPRGPRPQLTLLGTTSAEPGTRPILPAPVLRRNFQSTQGVFGRNLSIRFGAFCFISLEA